MDSLVLSIVQDITNCRVGGLGQKKSSLGPRRTNWRRTKGRHFTLTVIIISGVYGVSKTVIIYSIITHTS